MIVVKHSEKLEVSINELHIKIEELNRTIIDITSHKTRLSQENIELIKEVQDLKVGPCSIYVHIFQMHKCVNYNVYVLILQVNIESIIYSRSQISSQLEDARRRLEDDERRRQILEATLHQVNIITVKMFRNFDLRMISLILTVNLHRSKSTWSLCEYNLKRSPRLGSTSKGNWLNPTVNVNNGAPNTRPRLLPVLRRSKRSAGSILRASKNRKNRSKHSSSRLTTLRSRSLASRARCLYSPL